MSICPLNGMIDILVETVCVDTPLAQNGSQLRCLLVGNLISGGGFMAGLNRMEGVQVISEPVEIVLGMFVVGGGLFDSSHGRSGLN
jgi:hypothetical protein